MELTRAVYLSIGSNIENRLDHLRLAITGISKYAGKVAAVSPIYESEPVGFESTKKFLNACLKVETRLSPRELLNTISSIEEESGRKRNHNTYTDRTLDIDIIFFGDDVLDHHDLQIPHPRYTQRLFVLLPLHDLNKDIIDPVSSIPVSRILKSCADTSGISMTNHRLII